MLAVHERFDSSAAEENMQALAANSYPGRGIVLGLSEGGEQATQVYWVMGRSEPSRSRVLEDGEDGVVSTEVFDPSKVEDPALIIYNAMRVAGEFHRKHIVSNGDQTDTVWNELQKGHISGSPAEHFREALFSREFEPDHPAYTPRITAVTQLTARGADGLSMGTNHYSIIKRNQVTGTPEHTFGSVRLEAMEKGAGVALHTYKEDAPDGGRNIPSFEGSPYAVPLQGNAQETAEAFWEVLDPENRVAIVAKTIDRRTGEIAHHIINQLQPRMSSKKEMKQLLIRDMLGGVKSFFGRGEDPSLLASEEVDAEMEAYVKEMGWDDMSLKKLEQYYLAHSNGKKLPYARVK